MTSMVRLFAVVFSMATLSIALVLTVGLFMADVKPLHPRKAPRRGPLGRFLRIAGPLEVTIGTVVLTMGQGADGIGPIAVSVVLIVAGLVVLIGRRSRNHKRVVGR